MSSPEVDVETPVEPSDDNTEQQAEEEEVEAPADEEETEEEVETPEHEVKAEEEEAGDNDEETSPDNEETAPETDEEAQPETTEANPQNDSIYQVASALDTEAEDRLDAATCALTLLTGGKAPDALIEESEVASGQETQTIQEEEVGIDRSAPETSAMMKKKRENEGWLSTLDVDAILSRKETIDTYTHACKELCIVPTSFFAKRIATREIIMAHHGLGPKGAQAVAQVLTHNNTIEHLDLSANSCGLGKMIYLIL
jgi:hypothetical protein